MSLRIAGNKTGRWSLVTWLAVWHSTLAIALIASATAFSYWVLTSNLDREDDEFVTVRMKEVESRLINDPNGISTLAADWATTKVKPTSLRILLRVLNTDGLVLAAMPGSDEVRWPSIEVRGSVETHGPSGEWRCLVFDGTQANGNPVILQSALDRQQEALFLTRYRKQLYLFLFIASGVSAIGGVLISRRGLRPLRKLSVLAARIEANQMDMRLDTAKYAIELELVATTFNGMLDRLQNSFERLNRFSGDIAHELRTPLNNLRGEVEVSLTHSRTAVEYQDTLGSCLEETIKLSRLVDSLLFLARTDQPQAALNQESLNLDDELQTIQEFYEAAAEDAGIQLSIAGQLKLVIWADRVLFQRAIGNLITNSMAHTTSGGRIELQTKLTGDLVTVAVADTGVGIASDQLPHVFDRLYRGTGARIGTTGHGLGLAIVKTVVELHGGSVSIKSELGQGTAVETDWPKEVK